MMIELLYHLSQNSNKSYIKEIIFISFQKMFKSLLTPVLNLFEQNRTPEFDRDESESLHQKDLRILRLKTNFA